MAAVGGSNVPGEELSSAEATRNVRIGSAAVPRGGALHGPATFSVFARQLPAGRSFEPRRGLDNQTEESVLGHLRPRCGKGSHRGEIGWNNNLLNVQRFCLAFPMHSLFRV
jgi:hypothetical protein